MTTAGACVAIRVDASSTIGLGHASRCLALADALVRRGCRVTMLTAVGLGCLAPKAESLGCEILHLDALAGRPPSTEWPTPEAADAAMSRESLAGANVRPTWVVTDGYGFGSEWHRVLRQTGARILSIDERADRPLECDLLVDPSFPADPARYAGLLRPDCRRLLGPTFALLAPAYATARRDEGRGTGRPRRVIVSFGGSEREPGTLATATAVARMPAALDLVADVVVARTHTDRAAVESLAANDRRIHVVDPLPCLAALTVAASLAVGGGGGSAWERICLGVPSIVVPIADNQQASARALAAAEIVRMIEPDTFDLIGSLTTAILELLTGRETLATDAGRRLCDGGGADRVADEVISWNEGSTGTAAGSSEGVSR